jgi:CubicO group peptidase (beta-lactamase class C family)
MSHRLPFGVFCAAVSLALLPSSLLAQSFDPAAVDAVFSDIEGPVPGCAVGVVQDQDLIHANGFGMANLDYGLPITPRSNFYLGSVGKQFTAGAVAHAARAGHLSLDDPIQRWLPQIPEYERPVTVRHLVHHTSGIRDYLGLWSLSGRRTEDVHTIDETLDLIARQQNPNFPAGDQYLYSNSGYFLLSEILQRATGMSLRSYMEKHFLEPLGMERSRFNDNRTEVMDQRVVGYQTAGDGYRMNHPWNFEMVGSGGMYSNIEDLAHWDRNWYTEEVGGPGFSEQLSERGVLADGEEISYAFGLTHGEYRGLQTIGHGGSLAGFRAQLTRFPQQETTVLVLCSFPTSNPGARALRVADVVLAPELAPVVADGDEAQGGDAEADGTDPATASVELSEAQLGAFVGHWRASMGIEVEIVREGDRLVFLQAGRRSPVLVLAPDRLRLPASDVDMRLLDLQAGKFQSMSVTQGPQEFTAVRFDPVDTAGDHRDLHGEYHSVELDVTWVLFEQDGRLALRRPPGRSTGVSQMREDLFATDGVALRIDRGADGVRGFTIDAGRVQGIYFTRVPETE